MGRALQVPAFFVYFVAWFIFPSIFVLTGAFVGLLEKNRPFLIGSVAAMPWVLGAVADVIRNVLMHRTDRMGWKLVECFIYAGMAGVSGAAIAQRKRRSLVKSSDPQRLKPSSN